MRIVQCFVVKVERAAAGAFLSPTLGKNPPRVGTPPELLHNPFLKWEVSRTRVTPNIHIGASAAIP
jgi:hypothetical protein